MIKSASPDSRPLQVCVVCPCFNEEEGIEAFHRKLRAVLENHCGEVSHEIIFVDDGSRDSTFDRLQNVARQDGNVSVYSFARNFGHQIAVSAGLDKAAGDVVIVMDSDLQHPPEIIPHLLQKWQKGHDVVLAVRKQTHGTSWMKRLSSEAFYFVFNLLSDTKLTPGAADFALFSRRAYETLREMPERSRFLRGLVSWMGFKSAKVFYDAPARFAGKSKYNLRRMLALALDATFSFSSRPIRLATRVGALAMIFGLIYFAYIIGRSFLIGDLVPGWASLLSTQLILSGMQFMFFGLFGEYLVRVLDEVRGRPLYVLKHAPENDQPASRELGPLSKAA